LRDRINKNIGAAEQALYLAILKHNCQQWRAQLCLLGHL